MPPIGNVQSGSVDKLQSGNIDQPVNTGSSTGKLGPRSVEVTTATPTLLSASTSEDRETKSLSNFDITSASDDQSEKLSRSFAKGGSLLKEAAKEIGGATWNKLSSAASGVKKGAVFAAGLTGATAIGAGKLAIKGGKLAAKGGKALAKAVGNKFSNLATKVKNGAVTIRKIKLPRLHLPSRPKGFKLPGKSIRLRAAVKTQAKQSLHSLQTSKATKQQKVDAESQKLDANRSIKAELKDALNALKNPEQWISKSLDNDAGLVATLPNGQEICLDGNRIHLSVLTLYFQPRKK